ncbi:carbohydrate kinase family protein [Haloparvum alkalitolerans]|uniref:carbohydrate kinase family protein n=1 Tax=Haloparvum alkalitolerans TaxID=1042953 RepID=UPI003CE900F0
MSDAADEDADGDAESEADAGPTAGRGGADRDPPSVLCAGHINWDVTMQVARLPEPDGEQRIDHLQQAGGGSAANVAVGLTGLNAETLLFGSVGGDDSGALALQELDRAGVDPGNVMVANDRATSVKYLIVDETGEVMVLANEGANEAFGAADLDPDDLAGSDHLHLTGQNAASASDLAALAHERGVPVSFDPGRQVGNRAYADAIAASDLLFVNDREAAALGRTGTLDPEAPESTALVVKLGAGGAEVRLPGGERVHAPAYDVDVVDTTGAGDAFAAGFLGACFESARNHEPEREVDGGRSVEGGVGGRTAETASETDADRPRGIPGTEAPHLRDADLPYALGIANAAGALAARERGARTTLTWERIDAFLAEHA